MDFDNAGWTFVCCYVYDDLGAAEDGVLELEGESLDEDAFCHWDAEFDGGEDVALLYGFECCFFDEFDLDIDVIANNSFFGFLAVDEDIFDETLCVEGKYDQFFIFFQVPALNFASNAVSIQFSKMGLVNISDGHSERFIDGSRWYFQILDKIHKTLIINFVLSFKFNLVFPGDVHDIESADGYENDGVRLEANLIDQVATQSLPYMHKFCRIPLYAIHFVHGDDQLMNSE